MQPLCSADSAALQLHEKFQEPKKLFRASAEPLNEVKFSKNGALPADRVAIFLQPKEMIRKLKNNNVNYGVNSNPLEMTMFPRQNRALI